MPGELDAVLDARFVIWRDELDAFGYEVETPPRPASRPNQVVVFARRPPLALIPVTITIDEIWTIRDIGPSRASGLTRGGCSLLMAGWNAQFAEIGPPAELGAERLDVDPRKSSSLWIHRHPLGEPNGVRLPVEEIPAPTVWIEHVETLAFEWFGGE